MLPDAPLTEILASFVADTKSVPKGTIEPAKNVILDTIGVALAASERPIGKIISDPVTDAGLDSRPGPAAVFGSGIKTVAQKAGLANWAVAQSLAFSHA